MKKRIAIILFSLLVASILMSGGYGIWEENIKIVGNITVEPDYEQISIIQSKIDSKSKQVEKLQNQIQLEEIKRLEEVKKFEEVKKIEELKRIEGQSNENKTVLDSTIEEVGNTENDNLNQQETVSEDEVVKENMSEVEDSKSQTDMIEDTLIEHEETNNASESSTTELGNEN